VSMHYLSMGLLVIPEPGFVPPTERLIGAGGVLTLGPYAVALIDASGGS
jgi:hypothetical protein